jgi:dipeptidase D
MDINAVYAGLEPAEVWRHFAALNATPRPSGREAAARAYVEQVVTATGAPYAQDKQGNIVVTLAATDERLSSAPPVAVQAHLDMVCQKRPEIEHDFNLDPIRPRREGDLIFATGTTLGADNGIGAALALALATDTTVQHGPLELIFTVEEETGLHGALNLDPALVNSRLLINLDSEDPDELTVGCAGGAGTILYLPYQGETPPTGHTGAAIVVSGLKGGHSGVQIHEPLANAIKLLAGTINAACEVGIAFRLAGIDGGTAHNAIPRDATAKLAIAPFQLPRLQAVIQERLQTLQREWSAAEPNLSLEVQRIDLPPHVLPAAYSTALLRLLNELPHGVIKMSDDFPGKVETSSNLAAVHTEPEIVEVATSSRSFSETALAKVQDEIATLGRDAGANIEVRDGYPGWEPDPGSYLLAVAKQVYPQVFGKESAVEVMHAGLECGVLVSRLPGMEAISFGPLIRGAHTPEEHVYASTVESTWRLLTALIEELAGAPGE